MLERGSIDNPLTFSIGLLQLIFHASVFTYLNTYTHANVFDPNIPIFPPNSTEGLHFHFSAFLASRDDTHYTQYISSLVHMPIFQHEISIYSMDD